MDVLSPFIPVLCHSDWLPWRVLSTSWCYPSRPCVAFLAFVHLALFLALSLSPGNSLVSSWCDHSMLASSLWRCLTVPSLYSSFVKNPLICFLCCPRNPQHHTKSFHLKGVQTCFFILSERRGSNDAKIATSRGNNIILHTFILCTGRHNKKSWLKTLAIALVGCIVDRWFLLWKGGIWCIPFRNIRLGTS